MLGPSLLSRRMPVLAACWLAGFAPSFSLMLPSRDDEEGIGAGSASNQVNFPLSKKLGDFLHLHMNAGATGTPGARSQRGACE